MDVQPVLAAVAIGTALVCAFVLGRRLAQGLPQTGELRGLAEGLHRLQDEVARLAQLQDAARQEVSRSREAALVKLAEATQGIRGEIGSAHRTLAEVKALEHGRARQMDGAAESLRRLEAVLAGSASRGAAGENLVARALLQLPPDLLEINAAFGGKVVEFALRLPGGRLLPIDSKWPSLALLEAWTDAAPSERRRLAEEIGRDLRGRVKEMAKYLDPERTLALGLVAVPDAVSEAAPEAQIEAFRQGVLVVPYSLALAYVLGLYRLATRFLATANLEAFPALVADLEETLHRAEEEIESRLSRAAVQLGNSRDALREAVSRARRTAERLSGAVAVGPAAGRIDCPGPSR